MNDSRLFRYLCHGIIPSLAAWQGCYIKFKTRPKHDAVFALRDSALVRQDVPQRVGRNRFIAPLVAKCP
jgi:hypothetical protein